MKFRWKLMIITMLIVSFSFGFGGMLLIQYSYQASIKQEKRAARNSYEMILRMLKEINEMCLTELPEYYVPEFNNFVIVKELPYTKNGKLDLVSLEKIASSEIKTENISRKVK